MKISFFFPSLAEQKMIGKILDQTQNAIQQEELTLSKLRSLKKGLMQDLLTGKVRVNAL